MTSDWDLLRQFTREHSQDAFREIVRRHLDLVYSAALRQACSPQLAEEIVQSVFADLARAADRLKPDSILAAWLYTVASRTAVDMVRKESRRQMREQIAVEMNIVNATADDWAPIAPLLDEAMTALDETDRTAVLLRYFENRSLREIGDYLGISDDAAQKRVSRAVERLREFFSKRKMTVGAAGLAALISANSVQSAPIGLAATISSAVLSGATVQTSALVTATKTIAMTTIQKSIIVATLATAAGTGIYAARQNAQFHAQIETLRRQQAPLTAQIQELQQERDDATNQLAGELAENAQLESNSNETELLRLRAEVTRLENQQNDPTAIAAKTLIDKVSKLKQRFAETPGAQIPEMKFLTDEDWLQAANCTLDTDTDYRRAMAALRTDAESKVIPILKSALQAYLQANNQQFPADISQLEPYFTSPLNQTILDRWEVALPSTVPNIGVGSGGIITEKAAVDEIFDSRVAIGADGYGTSDFLTAEAEPQLGQVMKAYQAANNGGEPADVSQLLPYATTPEQQAAIQKEILKNSK